VRAVILSADEIREQEGCSHRGGDADKLFVQSVAEASRCAPMIRRRRRELNQPH
jgi:hypothetical protein